MTGELSPNTSLREFASDIAMHRDQSWAKPCKSFDEPAISITMMIIKGIHEQVLAINDPTTMSAELNLIDIYLEELSIFIKGDPHEELQTAMLAMTHDASGINQYQNKRDLLWFVTAARATVMSKLSSGANLVYQTT